MLSNTYWVTAFLSPRNHIMPFISMILVFIQVCKNHKIHKTGLPCFWNPLSGAQFETLCADNGALGAVEKVNFLANSNILKGTLNFELQNHRVLQENHRVLWNNLVDRVVLPICLASFILSEWGTWLITMAEFYYSKVSNKRPVSKKSFLESFFINMKTELPKKQIASQLLM